MAHTEQRMRSRRERIERLRERLRQAKAEHSPRDEPATFVAFSIMAGILDLLGDEP